MLAAYLYGPGKIRLEETAIPPVNDNEVLLKVKSAAICGTDIRMIMNGCRGVTESSPRILGHEMAGIIEKVGRNVKGYSEGMRVAVAPNMGCGACDLCVSGNGHMCERYRALGINLDGSFAEYVRIPEEAVRQGNIVELDNNASFDEAALNEPLSCVYNGFLRCGIKPGDSVLVVGTGPIGIMHAKLAKIAGAASVMLSDLSVERLEVCKRIDGSFIIIKPGSGIKEQVMKFTGGKGLDVCIVACPSPKAQAESLELMAFGGRICFFGGLPQDKEIVPINTNIIHYKQLVITGSTRASLAHYRKTLGLIAGGMVMVKDLATHRHQLKDFNAAVEMAKRAEGLKHVINFD